MPQKACWTKTFILDPILGLFGDQKVALHYFFLQFISLNPIQPVRGPLDPGLLSRGVKILSLDIF